MGKADKPDMPLKTLFCVSGKQNQNVATQSTLAAPLPTAQHTAQPKHATLCSHQPRQPVERHHADAAVTGVGCHQRLQWRLLQLRADSSAASTPTSTQGGTQGLQGLPWEG